MSIGFTYGSSSGATYGSDAGAQWSPGDMHWWIDDTVLPVLVKETQTAQDLTLTWQTSRDRLNEFSKLQDTAEKLDTIAFGDGSFETVGRAGSDGVHTLTPPPERSPPREGRDYLVASYDERPLDRAVDEFEISVSFRALKNRDPSGTRVDETRASDEWSLTCQSATIATTKVAPTIEQGTDTAADRVGLTLVLDPEQTRIFEESLSRVAASSVRKVPDGTNTWVDESADPTDANTVTITSPDNEDPPFDDGDWVVADWETTWLSAAAYRVDVVLGNPG